MLCSSHLLTSSASFLSFLLIPSVFLLPDTPLVDLFTLFISTLPSFFIPYFPSSSYLVSFIQKFPIGSFSLPNLPLPVSTPVITFLLSLFHPFDSYMRFSLSHFFPTLIRLPSLSRASASWRRGCPWKFLSGRYCSLSLFLCYSISSIIFSPSHTPSSYLPPLVF